MSARELLARLRDWMRRDRLDAELKEELQFHQAQLDRDASPRRLGNVTRVREDAREIWSIPWLDQLQQDVRYALRGIRRSPGFAATVIVTLGLGIGANAAMFGVIDGLMFRPFPYLRDAGEVHRVYLSLDVRGTRRVLGSTEYTRYLDVQNLTTSFAQHAAFAAPLQPVGLGDDARERRVATISASFFDFFDVHPVLGRFFSASEDVTPRGADVVVLGYDFWQSEFGGRDVLGQRLQVGSLSLTIIGIAPEGFVGVSETATPAAYMPITTYAGAQFNEHDYFTEYNWGWINMMVRRKPGVSVEQASADLTQAYVRSRDIERTQDPEIAPNEIAQARAEASGLKLGTGPDPSLEARTALWVTGVAVIVLLIACANVANLFLARALRRQRETAVRLALGVSRRRLMMQSLTESMVLALIGSAVGLLVAQWGGAAIRKLLVTGGTPIRVFTDWRTLGVATGVAVAAGILTGLAPALLSGRSDLAAALKAGAREGSYHRSRTRSALLVIQAALSVLLLVGASLFVRSLGNVKAVRVGYDADQVLLVWRNLRGTQLDTAQNTALARTLLETAQGLPGVDAASVVTTVPLMSTSSTNLFVPGIDSVERLGRFTYQTASADYFRAMGTRILRGRGFTPGDRGGSEPILIVSESMARVLWPGQDALGQCVRVGADTMPCAAVVGIAEDIVQQPDQLTAPTRFQYYLPLEHRPDNRNHRLVLRMHGDPASQRESVRQALQAVMPGTSYVSVLTLLEQVERTRRSWRLGATMFVAFGVLALLVAAVGLHGVIAYNVAQRMHELGVRVALGARTGNIMRLVVGQGMRFSIAGIALGVVLALLAGGWIQPLLFQQSARDPLVYGMVGGVLLLVALVACAAPALRAAKADPNAALRAE